MVLYVAARGLGVAAGSCATAWVRGVVGHRRLPGRRFSPAVSLGSLAAAFNFRKAPPPIPPGSQAPPRISITAQSSTDSAHESFTAAEGPARRCSSADGLVQDLCHKTHFTNMALGTMTCSFGSQHFQHLSFIYSLLLFKPHLLHAFRIVAFILLRTEIKGSDQ